MRISVKIKSMTMALSIVSVSSAAIPIGFQPVEYVASNGKQFVDTSVRVTRATKVVADYRFTAGTTGNVSLFGWAGGGGYLYGLNANFVTATLLSTGYTSTTPTTIAADTERHAITFRNGCLTFDGTDYELPVVQDELINEYPGTLALFARAYTWNSGASGRNWNCKAQLYSMQIYDGETLIRDYVPCVRRSDKVPGLFDQVTGTFATSGTADPLVLPPDAALELEYVESNGSQYVNTGVVAAKDLKTVVDYQLTKVPASGTVGVFGWMGGSGYFFGMTPTQLCQAFMASGYSATEKVNRSADAVRHVVSLENGKTTFDDDTVFTTSVTDDFANYPPGTIALMARHVNWNNKATGDSYSWQASLRLYSCKMTRGATVVRDYVPAKRISDDAVGLYDRANHTFTAATAGTLAAGPEIGTTVPVRDLVLAEVLKDGDIPAGVRVSYGLELASARTLYLSYGRKDAGVTSDLAGENVIVLATVPAGSDALTVEFPAEVKGFFAKRTGGFRLYLGSNPAAAAGVPTAYAPVEYLQAAGGEHVETDVVAKRDLRVVVDYALTEVPASTTSVAIYGWTGDSAHLFGARGANLRYAFQASGYAYVVNWDSKYAPDTNRHLVSIQNGTQELDNKSISATSVEEEFSTAVAPGTLAFFARHYNWGGSNSGFDWKAKARIYSSQVYDKGVLIRDYTPCVRLADGTAGLVNRLDGTFLPAVGSGATVGSRLMAFEVTDWVAGPQHGAAIIVR